MERKVCRACNIEKPAADFSPERRNADKLKSYCKQCMVKKVLAYRKKNIKKWRTYHSAYVEKNREALRVKQRAHYQATIDERRAYGRKYRKIYLKKEPKKIRDLARVYSRKRRSEDPMFRLILNLRRRLNHLLNGSKSQRTLELTGCDSKFLKSHLEAQFAPKMTWGNYGKWHVDHIIPLSKYNLFDESDLRKACH